MTTAPQTRRATAADIARAVGVSRATVGYVLNDTPGQTISASTRERVLDAARALGYRPHAAAQALASGRTRIVLLVLPDWPQDYSVRRYIEEASLLLDEAGYTLVTWTPHATGRTRPLWQLLDPDVVFGFLPFSDADVAAMREQGIRAIIPDPDVEAPAGEAERVGGAGPALQVQHLYELGHRRIAFASTSDPRLADLSRERHDVALRAATARGMTCAPPELVDAPGIDLETLVHGWVRDEVTGVVAYNDDIAAMVAGAAITAGLDVPEDVSVIGHDDSPLASLFLPRLSSVHLDGTALGRLVADLVLAKIEGREPAPLPPVTFETVIPRASTRRVG
ncbi:transcriptional regulator [Microbacterium testaceum StLB037]|uniref:Transcriptional regulator n=1 Tax=Microbacterium testaceum (strain StLB037) TaxID=979556 RepID=E8ND91_MICTS|nr:LacI family DNA-binding transcriptional regulator [Microbacterium testaceum]BAJ74949.1 transcriptional regulator [Microbacterium testaceum StLB037]